MRNRILAGAALAALAAGLSSPIPAAQLSLDEIVRQRQVPGVWLPLASPRASLSQTLGLTELEIIYHRPAVAGREIWGALVPYGQVWRSGANENTLISFSTDVSIEGRPLPAGVYGLHTLPGEEEWQLIFSADTTAWGSFSYDEARDVLRVPVRPQASPHLERMAYTVDEVDNESAVVSLRWEELRLPFRVEVDTHELVLASVREQLKGLSQFSWQGWNQAAGYCLQNDVNLEEALQWTDNSIQAEERYDNLSTRSQLLAKLGEEQQAAELRERALDLANAGQLHNLGRQLLAQGKHQEAMEIFERNVRKNGDAWFVEVGLARGYAALGKWDEAVENMRIAHGRAPEAQKAYIRGLVERLERQESI